MVHLMRKYKRSILTVLIALIIGPFVLWGGFSSSCRSARSGGVEGVTVLATVGKTQISAAAFQEQLNQEAQAREKRTRQRPTFEEMQKDGTAERILDGLINSALLDVEVQKMNLAPPRSYLEDLLKRDKNFEDENKKFSPKIWNAWLDADPRRNWNAIYDDLQARRGRQVLLNRVMAPAHVTDAEVREEFEKDHTKLQIKYVKIDPETVPTEEQIKQEYDKDPARYQIPEKKTAEFVAVSLAPPPPALVGELVTRARAGEDFAELAKKYSSEKDVAKPYGGDMGWPEDNEKLPWHIKALFALPVGTINDPVAVDNAYYIYKVTEELKDAQTGVRKIRASHIVIEATMDDAEREARQKKADDIAKKAKETGDLAAAATEAGLTVQIAASFSPKSLTIENILETDVYAFRMEASKVAVGEISGVIKARNNLYIAKVTGVEPPVPQPFEAVQDDVKKDTIDTIRKSPEHIQQVETMAKEIAPQVHSIADIIAGLPNMKAEVKETTEFTRNDPLYQQGLFVRTDDVYEAVGRKEPGALGGPIMSPMGGEPYFVELTKKTPPTDADWADLWPKEEKELRDNALMAKRNQMLMDYVCDLRERVAKQGSSEYVAISRDLVAMNKILAPEKTESTEEDASDKTLPRRPPRAPAPRPMDFGPPASE